MHLYTSGSPMRKIVGAIVTALLIAFGLMFGAILLAIIATVGVTAFGYLWWKTRALRKQMREQMSRQTMDGMVNEAGVFRDEVCKGEIIEGEVIRKVVSIEEIKR